LCGLEAPNNETEINNNNNNNNRLFTRDLVLSNSFACGVVLELKSKICTVKICNYDNSTILDRVVVPKIPTVAVNVDETHQLKFFVSSSCGLMNFSHILIF